MDDIAMRADVARATAFNYFPHKEDFLLAWAERRRDIMADLLARLRERQGRLFFLGVGGSAGNCSHAVNDFRKIVGIEAYAPTDNVSELTARTNDEGWASVFIEWLKVSRLSPADTLARVFGWTHGPCLPRVESRIVQPRVPVLPGRAG